MADSNTRASQLQNIVGQVKPEAGSDLGYTPPGGTWTVATDPSAQFLGAAISYYLGNNPDWAKGLINTPDANSNQGTTLTPPGAKPPPTGLPIAKPVTKRPVRPTVGGPASRRSSTAAAFARKRFRR